MAKLSSSFLNANRNKSRLAALAAMALKLASFESEISEIKELSFLLD